MDYRNVQTANRAARPSVVQDKHHRPRHQHQESARNAPGLLHYDSDRSTTLDSLKDLMAFSQRTSRARHDDILLAAKHARAQMPAQFREPPSSTGSHGTITHSSIHFGDNINNNNDLTSDSTPSSTFSAGPDAESTRASMHYQRGSHRVRKSTGRFGNGGEEKRTATDILSGVVNTSALFRTFKEWRPEDVTETGIFEDADAGAQNDNRVNVDADSTTNFGVIDNLVHIDKENCGPLPSAQNNKQKNGRMADAPTRHNRPVLQATVQNESQTSFVMTAAATQKLKPSPLRYGAVSRAAASAPAPAPALKKSVTTGSLKETDTKRKHQSAVVFENSPLLDDELSSPETSAGSREDIDLGIRTAVTTTTTHVPQRTSSAPPAPAAHTAILARSDSNDGVTNQSFIVPSKSFPLLQNLVTGTLRFTPGNYFYTQSVDAQQKYQLPAGRIPEDEKEIFVDIETIREEVKRLQEHDEMLQNEIVQGEIKYKSLLDRFYSLAHKSAANDFAPDLDDPARESGEENQLLQNKILELETDLDVIHTQYEEQAQISTNLTSERDAAVSRANAAAEKARKLSADLEALRERMAASAQRPNQEAQRRIQQLEQMVAERERVIKALKDERDAANSSQREEQRLHKERIARMDAEKRMLSGDHAKCSDEKYALTTAKDALAQKNTALKEKLHAVRQQCKDREATVHAVVERQRNQITKLQVLLREKEKSVHQLDENFRKLRESWSSKDETLMRMTEVLGQWPGGLPQEHRGTLQPAETTQDLEHDGRDEHEFDVYVDDFQSEQDDQERPDDNQNVADLAQSDGASDSGQSAVDHSMDENMTSAFIIPDLDFQTENVEVEQGENGEDAEHGEIHDQELERELAQVHAASRVAEAKAKASHSKTSKSSKPSQQKSVSFQATNHTLRHTTTSTSAASTTAICKHNRVNCVVCCQNAGPVGENAKVTVAVPRPIQPGQPTSSNTAGRRNDILPDPSMDPGSALAYVMKLLDDERRHLWMQILAMRKSGETEEALNDKQRPRRVLREAEELWNAYVLKVEQLNRLDDVLAGQRAAGQDMTREEIDVTITRILEV
ncbi:uncharacterized protein SPSK_02992 [Sporothrix schenckii 1099-18]|uniref:Cep57 centrosome microtubule-binding domain-containing protein n=1 Tax=Sporothrix schenckii 1099-18 TaxID=1397361 RepID=A0A0F2M207_SPOSC|nr:uncharacterized protein SPSK_02992 [Sporothrix schenckii 1099-18]KJR82171.1 hypothetical protein SPSK_02992 [Sporothrix schenckii 1099-18]